MREGDQTKSGPQLGRHRRGRSARPLDLFGVVPGDVNDAAMNDATEAEALMDDLLALLDAGLVVVVADGGRVRYAAASADRPHEPVADG